MCWRHLGGGCSEQAWRWIRASERRAEAAWRAPAVAGSSDPLRLLPELLRNAVSCLALACGFAIFAKRPGDDLSLLEELELRLGLTGSLEYRLSRSRLRSTGRRDGATPRHQHEHDETSRD